MLYTIFYILSFVSTPTAPQAVIQIAPIVTTIIGLATIFSSIAGTIIAIRKERGKMATIEYVNRENNLIKDSINLNKQENKVAIIKLDKSIIKVKKENKEHVEDQITNIKEQNEEARSLFEMQFENIKEDIRELKKDTSSDILALTSHINTRFDDIKLLIEKNGNHERHT